jgi:hypothetical protein
MGVRDRVEVDGGANAVFHSGARRGEHRFTIAAFTLLTSALLALFAIPY